MNFYSHVHKGQPSPFTLCQVIADHVPFPRLTAGRKRSLLNRKFNGSSHNETGLHRGEFGKTHLNKDPLLTASILNAI